MNRLKRFMSSSLLSALCLMTMAGGMAPVMAAAQSSAPAAALTAGSSVSDACAGIGLTGGDCGKGAGGAAGGVDKVIKTVVNILSAVVGVAAVIMIMIAGFKFVTSGGDSNSVSSAKSSIIYAIVGLVVVAMAQVIVHFVIGSVG